MTSINPSKSSGKPSNQAIGSGAGDHGARTDVPPSTSTAIVMQLRAETRPGQSGIPGDEPFRYCRTCDAQFEDYDERCGRVVQFCCFCADRLVRSVLGDFDNQIRPVNVSSTKSIRAPNGPNTSSRSRSPIHRGGSLGRRSRSPHTRIRDNSAERFRSSLSNLQGVKRQCSPTTNGSSNSQRDQLQNFNHGLEPSTSHENKKAKIATKETIEMGGKQGKEGGGIKITERVAEERRPQVGGSNVPHSRLPPRGEIRRVQAVPYEELHFVQQMEIEQRFIEGMLEKEKLEKEAKNRQKKNEKKEAEKKSVKNEPAKKKQAMIDLTIEDE